MPIEPDEYEKRVVARLCCRILTDWGWSGPDPAAREVTHSTSSVNGFAFESVRLERRHPDTVLTIYFRNVIKCRSLYGVPFLLWRAVELLAERPESRDIRDRPELLADHIWAEFCEAHDPEDGFRDDEEIERAVDDGTWPPYPRPNEPGAGEDFTLYGYVNHMVATGTVDLFGTEIDHRELTQTPWHGWTDTAPDDACGEPSTKTGENS